MGKGYAKIEEMSTADLEFSLDEQLYAEEPSTRDFERTLGRLWGRGLWSVSRANKTLHEAFPLKTCCISSWRGCT